MSFYSFESGQISVMWERDRRTEGGGDKDRLLHWSITSSSSSLGRTTLCYLQDLSKHFCFRTGCTQREAAVGRWPGGCSQWLQVRSDSRLTLTPTNPLTHGRLHKSFYNTNKFRSTTWLLPLIYPCVSCSEKSLIKGSVRGQYATFGRNIYTRTLGNNW